jgi:protocatechuate 3,4-dioxygenase beta subunit
MEHDDIPVGRILSRRSALALFGMAGVAFTAAAGGTAYAAAGGSSDTSADAAVDLVAKPEMTEGPYFVDERLNRSDLRIDTSDGSVQEGIPFTLTLLVSQIADRTATPLRGATVDIWHCNALGVYSDIAAEGTTGRNYLRGYQVTNSGGIARFTTILPGWYQGRTVHIHVKIRTTGTDGNAYEFTSQLFFTEQFKAVYLATEPYSAKGTPDTTNATDMHYADIGDQMLLTPNGSDKGRGYQAVFRIGLDLSDTAVGADDSFQQGGGGPAGGPGGDPSASPPPGGLPPA